MTFARPSPEYLVRTGSLKNKLIPTHSKPGQPSGNYAVYNIQTGCFTWQGRSAWTSHTGL